jgi:hypothetical protein
MRRIAGFQGFLRSETSFCRPRQIEAAAFFCSRRECDFVYSSALAARQSPCALIHKNIVKRQSVTCSSKSAFEGRNFGRRSPQIWPHLPVFLRAAIGGRRNLDCPPADGERYSGSKSLP